MGMAHTAGVNRVTVLRSSGISSALFRVARIMLKLATRGLLCAVLMTVSTGPAWAEDAEEDTGPWSGFVSIGYLSQNGNTDSTTFNGAFEVNWDGERWHHLLFGSALGKSEDNDTTSEAYKAGYKAKYDLSDRTYLFGLLDYTKDRFSAYDGQFYQTAGIGQRIIKTEKHELNGEISAGASQSNRVLRDANGNRIGTERINEAVFRVSADYRWQITDTSEFTQVINVTSGASNTFTESITELRSAIYGSLNMVLGYIIRNNSDVDANSENTDTIASISLEYMF